MIKAVAAGALALGAAGLGWGVTEARMFTLRRFTVPVLAPGEAPIRVLHVSDFHLLPSQHAKRDWIARLQDLGPDLVVNTGDNISSPQSVGLVVEALGTLLERPGVFVFGSNDYTGPVFKNPVNYLLERKFARRKVADELPWRELRDTFLEHGWADLNNARATLNVAGRLVNFRGTDDAHLNVDRYQLSPVQPGDPLTIGVTHAPYLRVLDAMQADGVSLILAGHTHGGQVCLPVRGALITNCDLEPARAKGLHRHPVDGPADRSWLHVSAGLGASPYAPYRTFCRPEASLLTLVPQT